ncbi:MAG: oligosaccharide flippase family protein [Pseudomonadota bacterium]
MIRKSAFIFGGNALGSLFLFVRNVTLARMLSVENYGVAMTFAITVAALELATNLAADRMLIQDPDGDDPRLQNTMHSFEIVRGAALALLLFVIAAPTAAFFQVPEATSAFQWLALVPMIRGFRNLDMFWMQRKQRFRAFILTPLIAQVFATILIVPLALYFEDYRAMLVSVIIQHAGVVALSHFFAERKYIVSWDLSVWKRVLTFGWPLMVNGGLLFVIMNGDRLIVANQFGPTVLGWFSAAFTLAMTPASILGKTIQTSFLPALSRRHREQKGFDVAAIEATQAGLLAGMGLAVALSIIGPPLFHLLYGARYDEALPLLIALGVAQGMRIAKSGPATVAVAGANTKDPMTANLVRILSFAGAIAVVAAGGSILLLALTAIAGEILSMMTAMWLISHRTGVRLTRWIPSLGFVAVLSALILYNIPALSTEFGAVFSWWHLGILVVYFAGVFGLREFRQFLFRTVRRVRS